jgi:inosine-uridine nucleoside N-ribohydrolase
MGSILAALLVSFGLAGASERPTPARVPVILDTDIGDDIDDAFALALLLQSPELDVRGVTTVFGDAHTRALIVCRLLHELGRKDIPVASGQPARARPKYGGQMQYGLRPCFRLRPVKERAVEFLYREIKKRPGELTLLAVGPLTNIAELLRKHPDCKPWIKRLVIMGGSVRVGYRGKPPPEVEWNIRCDIEAARTVFSSGLPLVVAPLDATADVALKKPALDRIFAANTPLTNQLHALYQLWGQPTPILFDPVAAALCFENRFCKLEDLRLEVDAKGITRIQPGKANAKVATAIDRDGFVRWYLERVAPKAGLAARFQSANVARAVSPGNMPHKIHVIESYETEIERRWWLAGKLETKNVPAGSKRACRGVLCNDFDDLMGDPRAMYTTVIFNPVPGPPMGPNTRLRFRCWLKGSDRLKVQLYSLSRGYHRHLTLTGLAQERWLDLTVDMTQARRPDGSGGPLAKDERIDDIQFYGDPRAELIISNIVLYDAAPAKEIRPFPQKPLFTAWFDTGKQGQEWPGDFEIVPKDAPDKWKAARSVNNAERGVPWIRLHLRGPRPLAESTRLLFRYHLTGADSVTVRLIQAKTRTAHELIVKGLTKGSWSETEIDFARADRPPGAGELVDEIQFLLPKGARLQVDDVLLYGH